MKKNTIDDLFERGLAGLERKPTSDAWRRIDQQQPKVKAIGWVWYVAASILLAFMTGYVLWQMSSKELKQPLAYHANDKTVPQGVSVKVEHGQVNHKAVAQHPVSKGSTAGVRQVTTSKSNLAQETGEGLVVEQSEPDSTPTQVPRSLAISASPALAMVEDQQHSSAIAPPLKAQEQAETNRTIIVNVSPVDTVEQPKVNRFARVFRQLKNARAGERVDWDEVGFNPRSVLARVESRRKQ